MSRIGLLDLRPLRASAPFRRLWVSGLLTAWAHQVVVVAVLFQVWDLTRSPFWTGAIGLASAFPLIVSSFIGGALADALDRRSIIRWSTVLQGVVATGLVAQAACGMGNVWVVLALVALGSAAHGLGMPARRSLTTRLLARDLVASGIALQHLSFQAAMILGPAIGGLTIGQAGLTWAYAAQLTVLPVALYTAIRLPTIAHLRTPERASLGSVIDGVRYIRRSPVVRGSFGVDLFATLLAMPIALFPMINEIRFGGAPETLGLFLSAVACGGIIAGIFSGRLTRADRVGAVQIGAAALWCVALACFGLIGPFWLALGALAVAGAADTVSVISRGALVQLATPDSHRGRVSAADQAIGAGGPDVGNARAGLVAGFTSAPFALVSGGVLALAGICWIALRNTELRQVRISQLEDIDAAAAAVDPVTATE